MSESAISANKVSLQELNQLIGIELLTSNFLENPDFQGGANARFDPEADPANKVRGKISVICGSQVSLGLRVH